ncbi:MAG TPA: triphosphoribosyl-dephospho-CoA synthase CitG [Tissierellaceae bacterium]|nr:triphosphoribosyl-dephospho-CoA synthase CitG [Tissierellaceae bacterium]
MNNYDFCEFVSNIAIKSILFEVSASPKPGLVDRYNSGAHKDMDFFTFIRSSSVLGPYFYNCTKAGIDFNDHNYTQLLTRIRPVGIKAEKDMFKATGGVNTHKGIIFSMGIIAAAAGSLFKDLTKELLDYKEISSRVILISAGITKELDEAHTKEGHLTYGEKLYLKYGTKGIRGEVESGFKTVLDISIPVLEEYIAKDYHINDILLQALLNLMAYTEDSNVLGRHNMEILDYVQKESKKILDLGGYLTENGKKHTEAMDLTFIEKNISPGGSADLLAVSLMMYILKNGDKI